MPRGCWKGDGWECDGVGEDDDEGDGVDEEDEVNGGGGEYDVTACLKCGNSHPLPQQGEVVMAALSTPQLPPHPPL